MQLVERWAEVAEPSPKARLAQAEAYLRVGLADRAWMSLRDLVEPAISDVNASATPAQYEALRLCGLMFVERGWLAKARRPLELAIAVAPNREAADSVKQLLLRAEETPADLPDEPIAGVDDVTGLVTLAQRHLVRGAQLKARKLAERARRLDPDNVRANELLWALSGDYSTSDATLAELVDRAIPDIGGGLGLMPEVTEETDDRTEEADRNAIEIDEKSKSFPSLFRGNEERPEAVEHEGTASMRMAELPKLAPIEVPAGEQNTAGDTQIARVIHRGSGAEIEPVQGAIHTGLEDPTKFDLHAFRREMGMDVTPAARSDYDTGFEDEDISRVVRVGRERTENTDSITGGLLEQLDPDTSGDSHRSALGPESPTAPGLPPAPRTGPEPAPPPVRSTPQPARSAPQPSSKATPAPAAARKTTEPGKRRRRGSVFQWYALVIGLLLLFGASVLFLLVLVTLLKG